MLRRALLKSLAAVVTARPLTGLRLLGQAPPIADAETATLKAIAEVVLPSALDRAARDRVVTAFVTWVRGYREGADRGHGYGSSALSQPTGPSPAARYPAQFAVLDKAAVARGAASFAALPLDGRRALVEAALNEPQPVQRLPTRPTGANLVADFMGFYFTSGDAWDLAYRAGIGRDRCRSLDGSDRAPSPIVVTRASESERAGGAVQSDRAAAREPRERSGESGAPTSERVRGFAGTKSPE